MFIDEIALPCQHLFAIYKIKLHHNQSRNHDAGETESHPGHAAGQRIGGESSGWGCPQSAGL
jgi:hypothetical protein